MWKQATRAKPCPICGHDHWCTRNEEKGLANCMRIKDGSIAEKVMAHGIGWLHQINAANAPTTRSNRKMQWFPPRIDFGRIWRRWRDGTDSKDFEHLARLTGLSLAGMDAAGFARQPGTDRWGIPMRDEHGTIIGIRIRRECGAKFALVGSRSGLFLPNGPLQSNEPLAIVEGPTDLAATLGITRNAIGRPSCSGGQELLIRLVQFRKFKDIVLIPDNDAPGIEGATRLKDALQPLGCLCRLLFLPPPYKDLREWVAQGKQFNLILT